MKQKQIWWCEVHNREATYICNKPGSLNHGKHTCAPGLGGIMLPCLCTLVEKPPTSAAPNDRSGYDDKWKRDIGDFFAPHNVRLTDRSDSNQKI